MSNGSATLPFIQSAAGPASAAGATLGSGKNLQEIEVSQSRGEAGASGTSGRGGPLIHTGWGWGMRGCGEYR